MEPALSGAEIEDSDQFSDSAAGADSEEDWAWERDGDSDWGSDRADGDPEFPRMS